MSEVKKRPRVPTPFNKHRPHSTSPLHVRSAAHTPRKPLDNEVVFGRRSSSLSPPHTYSRRISKYGQDNKKDEKFAAEMYSEMIPHSTLLREATIPEPDKDVSPLPPSIMMKMVRAVNCKKRELIRMRKTLIQQQNSFLELYATVRDMETRAGTQPDDSLGTVQVVSLTSWPAHEILLLIRDDLDKPLSSDMKGVFGPQLLQQMHAMLEPMADQVMAMGSTMLELRLDIVNFVRSKNRAAGHMMVAEFKSKNVEIDQDTEKLQQLLDDTVGKIREKINCSLELAKIPWLDRETFIKKINRLQRENMSLQHKLEETANKEPCNEPKEIGPTKEDVKDLDMIPTKQTTHTQSSVDLNPTGMVEKWKKERAAREALKDVVSAAEGMLRVARTRIGTLERQLKDSKTELDTVKQKHKELEQLLRHRENNFDARSKKLMEVSKTGEQAKEALSRQRDFLEIRVKELREQAELAEKRIEAKEAEQRARAEALQAKIAKQEKRKEAAEARIAELEQRIQEMEGLLRSLRERSAKLVEMERRRCLEYVPSKENEPSDRETEIWKELQVTRLALSKAEEELRQSRADKDAFLDSLSKIAQDGAEAGADNSNKISTELLEKELKIVNLQHVIEEQKENEKLMEQTMTQYENKLASLRLEVMRLRNYDCYSKDIPHQELQKELLDLHMQVETLTRERTGLVTAAASRALMLERHERAAALFARVTRTRRELAAMLEGRVEPPPVKEPFSEVSRSLTCMCTSSEETWSALRAERARVLRLETAVVAQSMQLEREGHVRVQLERRRALLERQMMRAEQGSADDGRSYCPVINKDSSLVREVFSYR